MSWVLVADEKPILQKLKPFRCLCASFTGGVTRCWTSTVSTDRKYWLIDYPSVDRGIQGITPGENLGNLLEWNAVPSCNQKIRYIFFCLASFFCMRTEHQCFKKYQNWNFSKSKDIIWKKYKIWITYLSHSLSFIKTQKAVLYLPSKVTSWFSHPHTGRGWKAF